MSPKGLFILQCVISHYVMGFLNVLHYIFKCIVYTVYYIVLYGMIEYDIILSLVLRGL